MHIRIHEYTFVYILTYMYYAVTQAAQQHTADECSHNVFTIRYVKKIEDVTFIGLFSYMPVTFDMWTYPRYFS